MAKIPPQFVKKAPAKTPPGKAPAKATKCPKCGATVPAGASKCPDCGKKM